MSKTVHPYGFRLGIIRDWRSRWFSARKFAATLKADVLIREHLTKELRGMYVESIEIERTPAIFHVIIKTSRPGLLIGRRGEGTDKIKKMIKEVLRKTGAETSRELKLSINEVKLPETHSAIVAQLIVEALQKRMPFRRAIKQMAEKVMMNKSVLGTKITVAGRLDGSEMSRRETISRGRVPLQTLRADIDFARERAYLPYGQIGVKVWIYRGDIFEDKSTQKENA